MSFEGGTPIAEEYRTGDKSALRVLFCIGISQRFFDAEADERATVIAAFRAAFDGLDDRLGVRVLGTMDDDELMVGPSEGWPWTCYILADVPDLEAVTAVTTLLRDSEVGVHRLWRYARIEARVGRPLFFGNG
jgi:hypothetical protein